MLGLPTYFQTREDWFNAFEYTKKNNKHKSIFIERLKAGLNSKKIKQFKVKDGINKNPSELTTEDYEVIEVDNPDYSKNFPLSDEEAINMINELTKNS